MLNDLGFLLDTIYGTGTKFQEIVDEIPAVKIDCEKEYTSKDKYALAVQYPDITDTAFSMSMFYSDMVTLADVFGCGKVNLVGADNNETFLLGLNLMDLILSGLALLPVNKSENTKKGIHLVTTAIKKYVPSLKDLGKLLAQAPELVKYADHFAKFGESLDKAIAILNENGDVQVAIDTVKKAIAELRHVNIIDIETVAKKNRVHIDDTPEVVIVDEKPKKGGKKKSAEPSVVVDATIVEDNSHNNNPEKKGDVIMTNNDVADKAAFYQGYVPGLNPQQQIPTQIHCGCGCEHLDSNNASVPDILNLSSKKEGSSIPAMLDPTLSIEHKTKMDPRDIAFSPVHQNIEMEKSIRSIKFVDEICDIANSNGNTVNVTTITEDGKTIKALIFNVYKNNVIVPSKTFAVDLGTVIDGRWAIWPIGQTAQSCIPMEMCPVAYHLCDKKGNLNRDLVDSILKYGFGGIDPKFLDGYVIYRDRILRANQRIDLITLMNGHLDHNQRSIIKGACIRLAGKLNPQIGRMKFESINPVDLSFILTNEGVRDYLGGPISPRPIARCSMVPKKDENGNHIPIDKDKGTDIVYDVMPL